jgi:diadenosine tetraphosphate (Ap4A) HIT family hydrolase
VLSHSPTGGTRRDEATRRWNSSGVSGIARSYAEAAAYGREVLRVARALIAVHGPVKLNYDVLGNASPHLHTHLVPRYADDPRPGWPFPFPEQDPPPIPEARLRVEVEALRRATR